jgi:hypothetical protein
VLPNFISGKQNTKAGYIKILLLFYLVKSQMHDPVRVYFKTGDIAIAVTGD